MAWTIVFVILLLAVVGFWIGPAVHEAIDGSHMSSYERQQDRF
jgi:cbb3-type cytochrome oxidase subunit 3